MTRILGPDEDAAPARDQRQLSERASDMIEWSWRYRTALRTAGSETPEASIRLTTRSSTTSWKE